VVRGVDGHAYAIDPDFADNRSLPNSGWIDLGLPPVVAFADGEPPTFTLGDSHSQLGGVQLVRDRATRFTRPRFTRSPTVVLGPTGAQAFMLDTFGRLQQIDTPNRRIFNRGAPAPNPTLPGDGPTVGDGAPRALSWLGTDNLRHVEVYVIDAKRRPGYLELQPGGTEPGGTWIWRAIHPNPLPSQGAFVDGNFPLANRELFYVASLGVSGTPDAAVFRNTDGVLHRLVVTRTKHGFFLADITGGSEGLSLDFRTRSVDSTLT